MTTNYIFLFMNFANSHMNVNKNYYKSAINPPITQINITIIKK